VNQDFKEVFTKYSIHYLLVLLVVFNVVVWLFLPRFRFSFIVIHHSASTRDNYESIRRYHQKKHPLWSDAVYHIIFSNGSTDVPAGFLEPTGRYRYFHYSTATTSVEHNLKGLHLCLVGNYDKDEVPTNLRAPIANVLRLLQKKFGMDDDDILFHRDCNATKCPGKHITRERIFTWLHEYADNCPEHIRSQQENCLAAAGFSSRTIRPFIARLFLLDLLIAGIWLTVFLVVNRVHTHRKVLPQGSSDE